MARSKKSTFGQVASSALERHNGVACVLIAVAIAVALIGVFAFVTFSGFGSSADFIYNQF